MQIGKLELKNSIFLAPMAGITDQPFRELCTHFGAGLTFSEMMWSNPRVQNTEKSRLRLKGVEQNINAVQIAGSDSQEMAQSACINVEYGADIIDINMGCPVKKVNRKLAGSALLRYPLLVEKILKAVVEAVDVPVTLKIRTGWDQEHKNCLEIAKIAEQAGVQALTIHGRTRACFFNGKAEYDSIKAVKASVKIPVIANGDINSSEDALIVLDYCNADGVMIGRASLGNPWIFQELVANLTSNSKATYLSIEEKYQYILCHIQAIHKFYGAEKGVRIARKHIGWYFDNLQLSHFKSGLNQINCAEMQLLNLEKIFKDQLCG